MAAGGRIVGLDGLRALAIALVLVDHAVAPRFAGGGIGVAIFFVLSGYLITSLLLQERVRSGRVRLGLFYARRALRLWPALLAMLAVTVVMGAAAMHAVVAGTYLTDIANTLGHAIYPYGHTWSLAVEEQFYLVWPVLLLLLLRVPKSVRVGFVSAAIAASLIGCALWTANEVATAGEIGPGVFNPLWQAHGILIGCLLAIVGRRWTFTHPRVVVLAATGGQVAIAVAGSLLVGLHLAVVWNLGSEVVAVAMIIAVRGFHSPLYEWAPVVWMGQRSYAIYLWHVPLILLLGAYHVPHSVILALLFTFALAEVSAHWVEGPFLALKDRLHRSGGLAMATGTSLAPQIGH